MHLTVALVKGPNARRDVMSAHPAGAATSRAPNLIRAGLRVAGKCAQLYGRASRIILCVSAARRTRVVSIIKDFGQPRFAGLLAEGSARAWSDPAEDHGRRPIIEATNWIGGHPQLVIGKRLTRPRRRTTTAR